MRELLTNDSFIDLIYQNCLTTKLLASLKIELNEIRRLDKWPVKVLLQTWNPDVGFSKDRNWSRACNEIPPTTSIRLDLPVHTNFHSLEASFSDLRKLQTRLDTGGIESRLSTQRYASEDIRESRMPVSKRVYRKSDLKKGAIEQSAALSRIIKEAPTVM